MFILLLTNILTCRMQEFKSLDNLSNYNKFVYIFQAVLNIFWKLLQLHIMINFFLLEFLGGGWWSHAGFSSCGGLTSGTPGTSYSPSIWRKWRGWSKKWGRGGRFYVFGSSTRLTYSCLIFPCNYLIYIRTYRYIYTGCRKRLSVVVYFDDPNSRCTES